MNRIGNILIFLFCSFSLVAAPIEVGGIYYNLSETSAEVTYKGEAWWEDNNRYVGAISIPAQISHNGQDYTVTHIGSSAFAYCTQLTDVTLPNTITHIQSFAFQACPLLHTIRFSNSLQEIGSFAFYNCEQLTGLSLPSTLQTIGTDAFSSCVALTEMTIPQQVTTIGEGAFSGCSALTKISVEAGNTTYHSTTDCLIHTASKTLVSGCRNSVIPTDGSVIAIGNEAFSGCVGLSRIHIPQTVTAIGDFAFYGCETLNLLLLNNELLTIGGSAFAGCSALEYLTIPNKINSIGSSAFAYCTGLKTITLPTTLTHIGTGIFAGCTTLNHIVINAGNSTYHTENNCIIHTSTNSLIAGCRTSVIPDQITTIAQEAFWGIPLASITLPASLQAIGDYAFSNCEQIETLVLPPSVTAIGTRAFADCQRLQTLTLSSSTPPTIQSDIIEGAEQTAVIVPCDALAAYKANAAWQALPNLQGEWAIVVSAQSADETQGTAQVTQQPTCADPQATLQATPAEGYQFHGWNDGNNENPRTVVVTEDITYIASFVPVSVVLATDITLDASELTIMMGKAARLTATVLPENTTDKRVSWASLEPTVAVVENGWVIGLAAGETTVTATTADGYHTAACQITVEPDTMTNLTNLEALSTLPVRKVFEDGTIYILRVNPQTGVFEKYTVDGRKVF